MTRATAARARGFSRDKQSGFIEGGAVEGMAPLDSLRSSAANMASGDSHSSQGGGVPQPRQGLGFLHDTIEGLPPLALFAAPLRGELHPAIGPSNEVADARCIPEPPPATGKRFESIDAAPDPRP